MQSTQDLTFSPEIREKMEQITKAREEINALEQSIRYLETFRSQPEGFDGFYSDYHRRILDHMKEFFRKEHEEIDERIRLIQSDISDLSEEFRCNMQAEKEKAETILAGILTTEKENTPIADDPEPTPSAPLQSVDDLELERLVEELKARKARREIVTLEPEQPSEEIDESEKMAEGFWNDIPEIHQEIQEEETKKSDREPVKDSKYSFVVGKVAGENLLDRSGKLIIAQNEIISEEVISKAELDGKLVELIINMKLP